MPLGFLANLGSGLARFGSAFGRGAAAVEKGIGRGFERLDEMREGDDQFGLFRTPGFNPSAGRGVSILEDAVAGAENDARGKADFSFFPVGGRNMDYPERSVTVRDEPPARADSLLERRNLPIPMPERPGGPPPLTPAPSLNELRTALPSLTSRPSLPLAAPPAAPKAVPDLVPDMDLDRRSLPIPRLPGHSGGPTPFNSIDAAKYDKVMSHAKRDAEGDLLGKSEGGGFRGMGLKGILQNALLGAGRGMALTGDLGGAIGGAATAGAGSAINPQAGYEFAFDYGERPKMQAEMARERAERAAAMEEAINRAKLGGMEAETRLKGAQADEARASIEFRSKDQELKRLKEESDARLKAAEIEATLTGQAKLTKVFNPETEQIEEVWTFPGGRKVVVGPSGEVELAKLKDEEETKRTKYRESADTGREAMRQAGQDRRQQKQIDAEKELAAGEGSGLRKPSNSQADQNGERVSPEQLQRYAVSRNLTPDKARENLRAMGYKVD